MHIAYFDRRPLAVTDDLRQAMVRGARALATLRGLVIAVRLRHFNCTQTDSARSALSRRFVITWLIWTKSSGVRGESVGISLRIARPVPIGFMRSRTSSTTSAIVRLRQFAADVRVIVEEVIQKSPVTDILIAVKGVVSSCDTDETSADFSRSLSSTARARASRSARPWRSTATASWFAIATISWRSSSSAIWASSPDADLMRARCFSDEETTTRYRFLSPKMSATRPNTDGLRSDVCSALTMVTDTTTRSWLAKRPAVQRMPHCYLLGTADAALDIWFETHALANAQLSARTQRHVLHEVHDASGAAKLSSPE